MLESKIGDTRIKFAQIFEQIEATHRKTKIVATLG